MKTIVEILGQLPLQDHNLLKRELYQRLGTFVIYTRIRVIDTQPVCALQGSLVAGALLKELSIFMEHMTC